MRIRQAGKDSLRALYRRGLLLQVLPRPQPAWIANDLVVGGHGPRTVRRVKNYGPS